MTATVSSRAALKSWQPLTAWLLVTFPAALLTLHATGAVPLHVERVPLTSFQSFQGSAYAAPLDTGAFPAVDVPTEVLYENDRPVRYPAAPGWGVVATQGQGRYHVGDGVVYMSATDNSDPRSNGRTYAVERPLRIGRGWLQASWALAALGTLGLFLWRPFRRLMAAPPFLLLAVLLATLVAANRAWLFTDVPLVAIHPDSASYYSVAEQLGSGVLPNFGNRPPVYPIFLRAVFSIWDRALFLAVCQTALSFIAALLLVYAAYVWNRALGLPAVVVMALYLFGFTTMEHDTAMLSESVYASCLMLSFSALLIGLRRGAAGWLAWSSTAMALAILTRPAGMFLVVTYLLVLAWLLRQRSNRRTTLAFAVPFAMLLVAMSAYNKLVVRAFAPTTWGEANLAVATFLYWETDPAYPPDINDGIRRIRAAITERHRVTSRDETLLDRSWDPEVLSLIFVNSFFGPALDIAQQMGGGHYETVGRQWIRRISFDSIGKHPDYYAKFVWSMLYLYFKPAPDYDFRVYLQNRAWLFYVARHYSPAKGDAFMARLGKEFATEPPPPTVLITEPDPNVAMDLGDRVLILPTQAWRVYHATHVMREALFQYWAWSAAIAIGLVGSLVVLVFTRLRHQPAFAVFIVTVSAVGASLVVSLVEYSQPRYSYPMEWAYGMSAVLLPLLFLRTTARAARPAGSEAPARPEPVGALPADPPQQPVANPDGDRRVADGDTVG